VASSESLSKRRNGITARCNWKLEAGSWKLEAGSWKLEAGSWKLEASPATILIEIEIHFHFQNPRQCCRL
jgi:hypothetical protein